MSGENKSSVSIGKNSGKVVKKPSNYEKRGVGSNPPPKSVSPGPPGSSKEGTKGGK